MTETIAGPPDEGQRPFAGSAYDGSMLRRLSLTVLDEHIALGTFGLVPRLLVVVHGLWLPEDMARALSGGALQTGVCGVSLGVSLAESEPPPEGWLHEAGASERCVPGNAPPLAWRGLGPAEMLAVLDGLAALGVPARKPDLDGIADTGDYAHTTTLLGAVDHGSFHVCLQQMQSGYGGRDAAAFAGLMRIVLGLAGLDAGDERWRSIFAVRERGG
jgi:hypothetical protein